VFEGGPLAEDFAEGAGFLDFVAEVGVFEFELVTEGGMRPKRAMTPRTSLLKMTGWASKPAMPAWRAQSFSPMPLRSWPGLPMTQDSPVEATRPISPKPRGMRANFSRMAGHC
jgi:hypothetical protein